MLRKGEIVTPGDSDPLEGEQADVVRVKIANRKLVAQGKEPADFPSCIDGYYQSVAEYRVLYLCRVVPGNYPRTDRSRCIRQG